MHRHASYNSSYAYPLPHAPANRYATHPTSSAQSPSANPDEDWTKISDLAERRRIQNRIAQRNYRKKLKRRLEDLERRAVTTSVSPEPAHADVSAASQHHLSDPHAHRSQRRRKSDLPPMPRQARPAGAETSFLHPSSLRGDASGMFSRSFGHGSYNGSSHGTAPGHSHPSTSSPPPATTFSYAPPTPYSLPELPAQQAPYPQHAPFHSLPAPPPPPPPSYSDYATPALFLPPLPASLPSLSGYEHAVAGGPKCSSATASDSLFADDVLGHFNMGYAGLGTGIEMPATLATSSQQQQQQQHQQSYADVNAYVNHPEYSFHVH